MRKGIVAAVVAIALVAVLGGLLLSGALAFDKPSSSSSVAPAFTLDNIYGQPFNLTSYRNQSVVVIEFTSLSCSECQIVEQSLKSIYSSYNATGSSDVVVISIYIEPSFGDTIPALKAYHQKNNITWTMAQDTSSLAVSKAYGVSDIPTVVIIDKKGQAVYDQSGAQSTTQLQSTIHAALTGTAAAISLVTVSVFALAVVAGLTTFFSPCAFPMFPGYMSLFLGLNTTQAPTADAPSGAYRGAVRRALSAGSTAALGMMIVFLIIGVALIAAASVVGGLIPYFLLIVGGILIALGALLLTNLQYWRIVAPLQSLWQRLRRAPSADPAAGATFGAPGGQGFYLKLFGYGMGYAAAAAGCVAPVILAAIVAGMAVGLVDGIFSILIYALTAALLMVGVTVLLAVAGQRYVRQLKAWTNVIKKVSAVALVLIGIYLVYFYYQAWIL